MIGCPGALVISIPVAVVAEIGRAAQSGILIKGGEFLETAAKVSVVAVDKTGTLTWGRPRLTDLATRGRTPLIVVLDGVVAGVLAVADEVRPDAVGLVSALGAAGSNVAIETADIASMGDNLAGLPEAIALARRAVRTMHQNVTIALVAVALLLAGVLFGGVTMAVGMLVHEASVLIVIVNAMRLLRPVRAVAVTQSAPTGSGSPSEKEMIAR